MRSVSPWDSRPPSRGGFVLAALALGLCLPPAGSWAALPSAPQRLTATPGNRCIGLVWDAPAGSVTNYVVYVDLTTPAAPLVLQATVPSTLVSGLVNGSAYSITVAAVNADGTGPSTAPVIVIPEVPPLAPASLTCTVTESPSWLVHLTWPTPPQQTGQIIGYTLYRSLTTPAQTWYAFITGTAGAYVDAGVNTFGASGGYTYRVAAVDQYLRTGEASPEVRALLTPSGAPAEPVTLTATAQDGAIKLDWTTNGVRDGYVLSYGNTWDGPQTLVPLADTLTASVTFANDGLTRYFSLAGILGGVYSPRRTLACRTLPPQVAGVAAFAGNGYVRLTWDPFPADLEVTQYRIYSGPSLTFLASVSAAQTEYTDPAGASQYQVRAVTSAGESAPGGTVVPPAPVLVPAPPAGVAAVPLGNTVTPLQVTWSANPSGDAVTEYRCYALDGPFAVTAVAASATSLDIPGFLNNGQSYRFFLVATNASGDSPASATVTTSPAVPATTLTAEALGSTVLLNWTPWAGAGATGAQYRVRITPASGIAETLATTTQTAYADAGRVNGTYTYTVETLNLLGQALPAWWTPAFGLSVSAPPTPPTRMLVVPGNAQVVLNWQSVASSAGYLLYRTTVPGNYAGPYVSGLSAKATSYQDVSGLVNTLSYYYSLTAINESGESTRSAESLAIPYLPASLPADPAIRAGQLRRTISLSWNASLPGSYPIIGYNLYRSNDGGGTIVLLGTQPTVAAASATIAAFTYVDTDVAFGQDYLYRLHPLDEDAVHALRHEGPAYPTVLVSVAEPTNRMEVLRNAFDPARGESAPIQLVQVQSGRTWIKVYNLAGEWIRTLFDQDLPAGYSLDYPFVSDLAWDGRNERGEVVASGVYLIHAEGQGKYHQTRKVAVIK
jgi:hypothetical protein